MTVVSMAGDSEEAFEVGKRTRAADGNAGRLRHAEHGFGLTLSRRRRSRLQCDY